MHYKGSLTYECLNENCAVIEVKVDNLQGRIVHVKRAAKLVNRPNTPFRSAICPECGRTIERLGPVNVAVCTGGRNNPHEPIEVKLTKGVYESDLEAKEKEIEA